MACSNLMHVIRRVSILSEMRGEYINPGKLQPLILSISSIVLFIIFSLNAIQPSAFSAVATLISSLHYFKSSSPFLYYTGNMRASLFIAALATSCAAWPVGRDLKTAEWVDEDDLPGLRRVCTAKFFEKCEVMWRVDPKGWCRFPIQLPACNLLPNWNSCRACLDKVWDGESSDE